MHAHVRYIFAIDVENIKKIFNSENDENTPIIFKFNNTDTHSCEGIKDITYTKLKII